ncbi:hypothetical protein EV102420_31_00390 [Pseudescherichia vulneris NBRC 102420]|uniref:Uncharacterized protein n=1 Tax=Pseudescherichia vulneris NBRC 102420 TaxID=1115515 RepID=A0A090VY89_PSEVU|nr:hypothetical protein EV102420_31_00390 [Pseudescherichia vulneris NBRC 102420]
MKQAETLVHTGDVYSSLCSATFCMRKKQRDLYIIILHFLRLFRMSYVVVKNKRGGWFLKYYFDMESLNEIHVS